MPASPVEAHAPNTKKVLFLDNDTILGNEVPDSTSGDKNVGGQKRQTKFYSQPMPKGSAMSVPVASGKSANLGPNPRIDKPRDDRFDSFKTWSGKLERQLSILRGKRREDEQDSQAQQHTEMENLPVDRYFDALEGPELDTLRVCILSYWPNYHSRMLFMLLDLHWKLSSFLLQHVELQMPF